MSLFESLTSLFRRTHEAPPNLPPPHSPTGLTTPDTPETHHVPDADEHKVEHQAIDDVGSELWGISFSIEYRDANENLTVRRVRIRRFSRTAQGWLCMGAFCYERKALRSFRLDRIVSIIDDDGVIWKTRDFFSKELHIDLGEFLSPGGPIPLEARKADRPGEALRRRAKDGLDVLVALAHADRVLRDEEVGAMLDYTSHCALKGGIAVTDDDCRALVAYVRRRRPHLATLTQSLRRLEKRSAEEKQQLLRAAMAVMDADGEEHPEEFKLMMKIRDEIEHA
ncbi:MAG TPA: TerB family tellurite resistance protein [Stellaceae bacterium]|jgi:tellurite resistance protein|nr:TerB family tellurite resistance protein [Stellaceae bacterium]